MNNTTELIATFIDKNFLLSCISIDYNPEYIPQDACQQYLDSMTEEDRLLLQFEEAYEIYAGKSFTQCLLHIRNEQTQQIHYII